MNTVAYSVVRDQAARLAARKRTGLPAIEADQFMGYLSTALRDAWLAAPWPGIMVPVEEFTVTNATVDLTGAAETVGQVLAVWSANPRTSDLYRAVEYEHDGDELVIVETTVPASVWVDYLPVAPRLATVAEGSLATYEVDERFVDAMAYWAAGQQLRSDGLHAAGAEYQAEGERRLAVEIARQKFPERLSQISLRMA